MLVYVVAIVVAILIVPLTGGQFRQLGRIRLRRVWLLFAGLGLQILLEVIDLPRPATTTSASRSCSPPTS